MNKNGNFCLNISAKPGAKETTISGNLIKIFINFSLFDKFYLLRY